ncbi:MAG: hypothetical protein PHW60_16460 [Kiritimatiellae bacterium]|nr:hypothetical protein [Kiritimatiellia bacterium]
MDLTPQIEAYLLERRDWVKSRELCERFGVSDRQLRAIDDRPGLCSRIAISGTKGFKHLSLATPKEEQDHYARQRKHSIMQLVNLRINHRLYKRLTRQIQRPAIVFERDSGQLLMAGIK